MYRRMRARSHADFRSRFHKYVARRPRRSSPESLSYPYVGIGRHGMRVSRRLTSVTDERQRGSRSDTPFKDDERARLETPLRSAMRRDATCPRQDEFSVGGPGARASADLHESNYGLLLLPSVRNTRGYKRYTRQRETVGRVPRLREAEPREKCRGWL